MALVASLPVYAQPDGRDPPRRFQQERPLPPQRELPRRGADEPRRDRQRSDEAARPGRLSPEERQQLRRDIREAGRDVYRDRPRGRP